MEALRVSCCFKWSFLFLGVLGAVSCSLSRSQMNEVVQLNAVPIAIQPLFASCSPSDGEVQLGIEGKNIHVTGISAVWNIPDERTWDIQFNSPMGDTRLALHRKNGQFSAVGDVQLTIDTDRRGFMTVNEHLLPLRDSELPCVLGGRWPVEWFQFLRKEQKSQGSLKLAGQDDVRNIDLVTTFSNDGHGVESCAVIEWGGFLGLFKHSAELCIRRANGSFNAELKGPSHYIAKWSQQRDES